jgi:hypothetical protein
VPIGGSVITAARRRRSCTMWGMSQDAPIVRHTRSVNWWSGGACVSHAV